MAEDPSLARVIDTVLEIAATMARLRCPLVAVVKDKQVVGAITASRLLELVVPPD